MKVKAEIKKGKEWNVEVDPNLNKHSGKNYAPEKMATTRKYKDAIIAAVNEHRNKKS